MKRIIAALVPALLIFAGLFYAPTYQALAQNNINNAWSFVTTTPSGGCNQSQARVKMPQGTLYTCVSGTWTLYAGSGGTVTSVSGTANQIAVATGTTTPVISIVTSATLPGLPTITATNVTGLPLTTGVTGVLPAGNGGTAQSSYTKGDLLCPSGSTTITKLAVGSNTQVLTADSGETCGIKWASGSSDTALSGAFSPFGNSVNSAVTAVFGSANNVKVFQFQVPRPGVTFANASGYSATATGHYAFAVYDSTCTKVTNGQSSTATASVGPFNVTFTAVTLTAGTYYMGFSSDDLLTTVYGVADLIVQVVNEANQNESSSTYPYFLAANQSTTVANVTTLPATCGASRTALANQLIPHVVVH